MRATKKKLVLLSGALAACVALFLALTLTGREDEAAGAERYYFTNYASPQELVLASVENAGGSMILAQANGTYQAISDASVPGDPEKIEAFFEDLCRLPLERLVEGAQAGDPQYGLTEPRATVLVQDTAQGGAMFLLGGEVPGGEGVYTCLSGDERVFVMGKAYARLFLENVQRFLDLRLYPSLKGPALSGLTEIEVRRNGQTAYRLERAGVLGSETVYFALREPWSLLLGAEPVRDTLLTPLGQLEGVRVLEGDPASHGLTEASDSFRLSYEDGTVVTVCAGPREGEETAVTAGNIVLSVPTASLAFLDASAEEVMGGVLMKLNLNDISALRLNGHTYELESDAGALRVTRDGEPWDAAGFQTTLFPALNHISIGGPYDGAAGAELLRLHITSNIGGEDIDLTFRELDGRRCAVEIGGQTALWCDLAAVSALLRAAD